MLAPILCFPFEAIEPTSGLGKIIALHTKTALLKASKAVSHAVRDIELSFLSMRNSSRPQFLLIQIVLQGRKWLVSR